MAKTTELIRRENMRRKEVEGSHDGRGIVDLTSVYGADQSGLPTAVRFIHDDILSPGSSIGYHKHADDEEFYIILSGTGIMELDDEEFTVTGGDVAIVYPGGHHGLRNESDEPLHLMVIGASRT